MWIVAVSSHLQIACPILSRNPKQLYVSLVRPHLEYGCVVTRLSTNLSANVLNRGSVENNWVYWALKDRKQYRAQEINNIYRVHIDHDHVHTTQLGSDRHADQLRSRAPAVTVTQEVDGDTNDDYFDTEIPNTAENTETVTGAWCYGQWTGRG